MDDLLQRAAERVQDSMDAILANFKPGAKITVLVRTPDTPTADFCMSDDNLWEVTAMVQRRMAAAGYPVVSSEPLAFISQKAFGQLIADRSSEYLMTVPRDKPGPMEVALFTWTTPVPEANPPASRADDSKKRRPEKVYLKGFRQARDLAIQVVETVDTLDRSILANAISAIHPPTKVRQKPEVKP